mgnify:CR=1 FL=1|tara:strand:+ start:637 stop:1224 length:588 start_codon:yes stop_codon:yes gene_type:complete
MGILKRGTDLVYTFRFIRMMVMDWKSWDAYKEGVIDENGKRIKSVKLDTDAKKNSYTPFIRLAANIKRLVSKIPGGGSKLGSFASALFLIKEQYGLNDDDLRSILQKVDLDSFDFLNEQNDWFILKDRQLSPGIYKVSDEKLVNKFFEQHVNINDKIKVFDNCYPVGDVFGIDIYEVVHMNTNQKVYVTASEIYK